MGLFSNRIDSKNLKPGDHIYSWRSGFSYAHHGIYIGDNKVIHFTRDGQEIGTGTSMDSFLVSSRSSSSVNTRVPCPTCILPEEGQGVMCHCLECFLSGGKLYRFEYSVNSALFLAKCRGGTCSLVESDPGEIVVKRAKYLLKKNGFGCYNLVKNNCEDFAIYCKTELIVLEGAAGQSGQVMYIINGTIASLIAAPVFSFGVVFGAMTNFVAVPVGCAAFSAFFLCRGRFAADIGSPWRSEVKKVSVEELCRIRS